MRQKGIELLIRSVKQNSRHAVHVLESLNEVGKSSGIRLNILGGNDTSDEVSKLEASLRKAS